MVNPIYEKLAEHIGHAVVVVQYGDGENVAVECEDCHAVLTDADREIEDEPPAYGAVGWCAEDVQTLRPDLTDGEAQDFLQRNEKYLRERLTELGWDAIQIYLDLDDQLPPKREGHQHTCWTCGHVWFCTGDEDKCDEQCPKCGETEQGA